MIKPSKILTHHKEITKAEFKETLVQNKNQIQINYAKQVK